MQLDRSNVNAGERSADAAAAPPIAVRLERIARAWCEADTHPTGMAGGFMPGVCLIIEGRCICFACLRKAME